MILQCTLPGWSGPAHLFHRGLHRLIQAAPGFRCRKFRHRATYGRIYTSSVNRTIEMYVSASAGGPELRPAKARNQPPKRLNSVPRKLRPAREYSQPASEIFAILASPKPRLGGRKAELGCCFLPYIKNKVTALAASPEPSPAKGCNSCRLRARLSHRGRRSENGCMIIVGSCRGHRK